MKKILGELSYSICSILFMISILPQIIKIYVTKSAKDISMNGLVLSLIANILQIFAGIFLKFKIMFFFGCIYFILIVFEIFLKIFFDKEKNI
jgi:uncharacterized protein with PQ loop repeat